MTDVVKDYQAAMSEFLAAEKAATDRMKLISSVSSVLHSDLPSFMGWQYSEGPRHPHGRTQHDPKAKFEMSSWPTAEDLKSLLLSWHRAHVKLTQAWEAVKAAGATAALVEPPASMNRRGS